MKSMFPPQYIYFFFVYANDFIQLVCLITLKTNIDSSVTVRRLILKFSLRHFILIYSSAFKNKYLSY